MTAFSKLLGAASAAALLATSAFAQDSTTPTTTTGDQARTAQSDSGATQSGTQPMTQGTGGAETATAAPDASGATQPGQPTRQGGSQTATAAPDATRGGEQMAAIEVESQPVRDGQLKIDLAYMPEDGFVAIHQVQGGKLIPDALGYAPVKAGESTGIEIPLDKEVAADTEVVAMLHRDTGKMGTYEFGARTMEEDRPELIAGQPIAVAFLVTAPDGSQQAGAQQPATMPQDDGSSGSEAGAASN